ncbi:hypothetical protein QP866_06185 [Corynebacterium imitans]|uniref:hypothetical protein n=1 Tax=Corynebacterium imitans TaxID=156978 RepID=UPI00254CF45E|nr:hypothetical protein [Corynebacterium imitans]MDK8306445.1 hypothetical protein [Corynebacterium imitans]MDK8637414.1 hypothetical protein [Corynebacterium imitans]MDK8772687.1 hypothetical protein [Corynebacterium imitans]
MVDPEEHQGDDPPTAELPALSPEGTLEQDVLWDDDAGEGSSVRSTGVWVIGGIVALAAIVIGVLLAASATSLAKGGKTPDPVTNTVVVTSTRLTEVTTTRVVTTQPTTSSNPATKKAATKTAESTTKGGSVSAKATTTSPKKAPKKTTTPTTAR